MFPIPGTKRLIRFSSHLFQASNVSTKLRNRKSAVIIRSTIEANNCCSKLTSNFKFIFINFPATIRTIWTQIWLIYTNNIFSIVWNCMISIFLSNRFLCTCLIRTPKSQSSTENLLRQQSYSNNLKRLKKQRKTKKNTKFFFHHILIKPLSQKIQSWNTWTIIFFNLKIINKIIRN